MYQNAVPERSGLKKALYIGFIIIFSYGEVLLALGAGGPHLIGWMLSPISTT